MPTTAPPRKPDPLPTFGARVRSRRALLGLTQEEVAAQVGFTSQALSLIENDLTAPRMENCQRLATALGVTTDWLLHGDSAA